MSALGEEASAASAEPIIGDGAPSEGSTVAAAAAAAAAASDHAAVPTVGDEKESSTVADAGTSSGPAEEVPASAAPTDTAGNTNTHADEAKAAAPSNTSAAIPPPSKSTMAASPTTDLATIANDELAFLLTHSKINQSECIALQKVVRENVTLRDKITRLKSLLSRSAKAQKDAKAELEQTRRRLERSEAEGARLRDRVESLTNRPSHLELLADFETNFDKALLSMGTSGGQSSGEHPSSSQAAANASGGNSGTDFGDEALYDLGDGGAGTSQNQPSSGNNVESALLLSELSEAKSRVDKLESLNAALLTRASKLEKDNEALVNEKEKASSKLANLTLELRMAKMEADHAARSARDRESSLAEMQLEIDLVTKSAIDAQRKAAEGMEAARTVQTDKELVKELEVKVKALQEWALASAEAKQVAQERAARLEEKLRDLTEMDEDDGGGLGGGGVGGAANRMGGSADSHNERRLWSQHSSLVVGAGLVGSRVHVLGDAEIQPNESVVLRWKFDLTPSDTDILFSILKGWWEVTRPAQLKAADAIIRSRNVTGGAAGEAAGAFAVQNACSLVWSNERSWVRPKTIKYTVEAFAVM